MTVKSFLAWWLWDFEIPFPDQSCLIDAYSWKFVCVCVSKKTPDSFWSQFFVVLIWKVFTISSPTTWMARKWRYDFHGTGKSPFFIVDFGGSEIFPGSERRQLTHQDRRRRSRVQRPLPGQKTSEKRRQNWGRSRMIILWSSYDHPKHPMYQTSLITKIPKSHPRPPPQCFCATKFRTKSLVSGTCSMCFNQAVQPNSVGGTTRAWQIRGPLPHHTWHPRRTRVVCKVLRFLFIARFWILRTGALWGWLTDYYTGWIWGSISLHYLSLGYLIP